MGLLMEMLWVHLLDFLSGMLLVYQLVLLRDFLVGIAEGDDLGVPLAAGHIRQRKKKKTIN